MNINIKKIAEKLQLMTPDLITRPSGHIMYESIKKLIRNIKSGEIVVLDFEGIKVVDSSFVDEMIVKLIMDSREGENPFYIRLKNMSLIGEINIDLVFKSCSNYKNEKIVVITENMCQNNSFFIGPLPDKEKDIIEFIRVNRSVTLDDLALFAGLTSEEVKRIMDELFAIRVVRKEENGIFSAV